MDQKIIELAKLPQILQRVSVFLQPTSPVDYVALLLFTFATIAYLSQGLAWDKPDPFQHIYFERPQLQDGASSLEAQAAQRNIALKLEEAGKRLVVFWGSQSGTAEGFANRLASEFQLRFGLSAMTADLSDYDPESIAQLPYTKLAIFILSTYGEGDPSDNANAFWEWINTARDVSLSNLQYAAFGLGNSNYKYYNRVVDVTVENLNRLGARAFLPLAKADDIERATEEDFISWKEDLLNKVRQDLQLEERPMKYRPSVGVMEDSSLCPIDLHDGQPVHSSDNPKAAANNSPIKALVIKSSKELFAAGDRNCVHMELDLTDQPELHYKTGDHLAVWPTNPDQEVEYILTALGLQGKGETPLILKALDPSIKVKPPSPTTANALFRYYLEICAPLSRATILGLAEFAPTPEAKSYVSKLGQDRNVFADFITHTHLNLGRLLFLASPTKPWSDLPLSYVIEVLPAIQQRYYSISSSSIISPRRPAITALVSTTALPANTSQVIHGVTSNYLLALSRSDPSDSINSSRETNSPAPMSYTLSPSTIPTRPTLHAHIRKSKFKLPIQSSTPIIMIAAGTGLAPFRAFIGERAKLHAIGKPVGQMMLFFGCRHPEQDYIYREEIQDAQNALNEGDVAKFKITCAFSRVEGERKMYVQDRVQEHAEEVVRLIEQEGASFFICGRASMAREVGMSLRGYLKECREWSDTQVKEWGEGLKRQGKWKEDVWG